MTPIAIADIAAVACLGMLCFALRVTFVTLVPADRLPDVVSRGLQHLAPAALASICAVELTGVLDNADLVGTAASVAVVALAIAVSLWTRSIAWTVLVGVLAVLSIDLVLLAS